MRTLCRVTLSVQTPKMAVMGSLFCHRFLAAAEEPHCYTGTGAPPPGQQCSGCDVTLPPPPGQQCSGWDIPPLHRPETAGALSLRATGHGGLEDVSALAFAPAFDTCALLSASV